MEMDIKALFELLFDEHEYTCFAQHPRETRVQPVKAFHPKDHAFFAINPLDPRRDKDPLAPYHHSGKPRRADHNVTVFRNILIELDKGPLREQWALITKLGLPYSSAVSSGGKSYHFILSLEDALPDRAGYDALVKRIYSVLGDRIDQACKNPSRLSRTPGHFREETQKYQNLCDLRARVSREELEDWLDRMGAPKETLAERKLLPREPGALFASTRLFLSEGAEPGSWNNSLFKAACDTFGHGWTMDDFIAKAELITGHLDMSDLMTIRSAWQRAGSDRRKLAV